MIIRICFLFILLIHIYLDQQKNAITRCGYMLVLGNGRSQSKY